MTIETNHFRLLIVDDNEAIHDDLKKILLPRKIDSEMAEDEALLFGATTSASTSFEIDSAFDGHEGFTCLQRALAEGRPYALAFVDVRMPPGWDGIETIGHLWRADPDLQIVICTAYSDYNWMDISLQLGVSHNFVVLKKPFDIIEITQLAHAMTAKWASTLSSRVAERRLQESEARFRETFEHAPGGVCTTGLDGRFLEANAALCRMLGYSKEELLQTTWMAVTHSDDLKSLLENMNRLKTEPGQCIDDEHRSIHHSGNVVWVHIRISLVRDAGGDPLFFVALFEDITARREADQALIESEHRFRIMADSCPIGIWVTDSEGETCFVNQAYREFAGWASEQVELDGWKSLIHPDDAARYFRALNDALHNHVPLKTELRSLRSDCQWRWVEVFAAPRFSQDCEFLGLVGTVRDVTDRKEAEQALRSSEEKFRQLAENISEVFRIVPIADDKALYVSPAYEQIWGRSLKSIYENPASWLEAVHPDDREQADQMAMRQLQGEPVEVEYRIHTPAGLEKWIRDRTFPIRDRDGKIIRIAGLAEDITEQKRAEELLKQTTDRLALATRAGVVGVWDWDVSSGTMFWDEQMIRLYGIAEDQFRHTIEDWKSRLHSDDREGTVWKCNAALRSEGDYDTEFRVVWPDGSVHSIRALGQVERNADGNPVRMIGTNWDITAQKRTEELLKQTMDHLALAASAGSAGIWDLDYVDGVLHWDEQMFRLYCTTRDKFSGVYEAWQELMHPEDRSRVNEELNSALRGEREFDCQFRIVWPDGSIRHMRANALVKGDTSGKPIRIAGSTRDITSQKEAAAALLESNRRLQLGTERARESSIAADAANAAKGEFLANMSHEIRTPMNGVVGMVGLLLDTELTAEQRRYAEIARTSGESLLQLINDILDFSKIEAKKLELEIVDFDLRILLDLLDSTLSTTTKAKGIELLWIADPAVPTQLRGDLGRLRQILTNLVTNAIKFTKKGEVMVSVTIEEGGESDCLLRFSVRDTGIGIPEDKIGVLFKKFSQLEASTTRRYGGTGLGLAISKQLAELMGGTVGVTSQEGTGSEFWFTVRLEPSLGLNVQPQASELESQAAAKFNGRVLIAEDNSTNREVILGMIRKLGLRADAVANGAEAVNILESTPYDLVLMDMRMPVMDGIDAARQIRNPYSAVLNHGIPIIALTANAMQSDREACLAAGMDNFLSKPITKTALRNALSRCLLADDTPSPAAPIGSLTTAEEPAVLFDRAGVLHCLEGDEELASIVFAEFLQDIPGQIHLLKDLVKSGNAADAARQAHSIRGASAIVGGQCLRQLASKMEKAADAGDLQFLSARLDDLEYQFSQLKDAIEMTAPSASV